MNPSSKRSTAILIQLAGLLCLPVYRPWGLVVGLVLVIIGGRMFRSARRELAAMQESAQDGAEAPEPTGVMRWLNVRNIAGIVALAMVINYGITVLGPNHFNDYIGAARPHLEAMDEIHAGFGSMAEEHADKDDAWWEAEVARRVDQFRQHTDAIVAIEVGDEELEPVQEQMNLYVTKSLAALEVLQSVITAPAGAPLPEKSADALNEEALAALDEFIRLRNAYGEKHGMSFE